MIRPASWGYGLVMTDDARPEQEVLRNIDDLALLGRAMALASDLDTDDGDEDEYWRIIRELHRRGTTLIFEEAARMTLSEDPHARGFACDVLAQLGYESAYPFAAETFPLLARLCTEETSSSVLDSAISALGHIRPPEALPYIVAHARHADPKVRFSVACALPSVVGVEWLDQAHPAVTTLMQLTSDEDADVRDWATFGLGTQINVDGAAVRQCLLARVDDPDEDTRAEAMAGLARRHAPEVAPQVLAALCADRVSYCTVESASLLGDPDFAERLDQLTTWWVVDVGLLKDAQRRCAPTRVDEEAALVRALLDAAEFNHLSIRVSSELLWNWDPKVSVAYAGSDDWYGLGELMQRAGGSVDKAVRLIRRDLNEAGHPASGREPRPRGSSPPRRERRRRGSSPLGLWPACR